MIPQRKVVRFLKRVTEAHNAHQIFHDLSRERACPQADCIHDICFTVIR